MTKRTQKKITPPETSAQKSFITELDSWVERNRNLVISLSLLINLLLCLALFDPKLHTGGDNASYIILAKSILTTGDGFSQHISPGPPQPQTMYPFGYPLALAPLVWLFGTDNAVALKSLSILFSLGTILFFSVFARRLASPLIWAGLVFTLAVNPILVEYSHWILSEMMFQFFSILTVYLMFRAEEDSQRPFGPYFWLGLVVLVFSVHIRSIGIAFILAGFVYYILRKSWRRLAVFTVAVSLLMAPWMIRNKMADNQEHGYVYWTFLRNPYNMEEGHIGVSEVPGRIIRNLKIYSLNQMCRVVRPIDRSSNKAAVVLTGGIFSLLIFIGLTRRILGGFGLLEVYVVVYLGVLLARPEVWSDVRFIMPLIPFFLVYVVEAVSWADKFLASKKIRPGTTSLAALLVIIAVALNAQLRIVPDNLSMIGRYLKGDSYAGYPANWRNFFIAADWVRENTPKESVVTVRKPRLFYIHTDHLVDGYPFTTDTDSVLKRICSTDYVVVDAVSGTTFRYLVPAIQKAPERFKLVYRLENPFTGVLEVVK